MNKWKILALVSLILFTASVSAISASIKNSCSGEDEVNVVSLNDTDGGHIAEPGYYGNELCVTDIRDPEIKQSCGEDKDPMFSLFNRTNSHFTISRGYSLGVCIEGIGSYVDERCNANSTALFSVKSANNSHVGDLNYYDKKLCIRRTPPENVTLTIEGVSGTVYADGNSLSTGNELTPPVEYPYLVSNQPLGIVSYGEFIKLSHPSSSKITMTQSSGSFLLPFTSSGYQEVEDDEEAVLNRKFLDPVSPSFGFPTYEIPLTQVRFTSPHNASGFSGEKTSNIEISVKNRGLSDGNLLLDFSIN